MAVIYFSSISHLHQAERVLTKLSHIDREAKKSTKGKSVVPVSFLTSCLMRTHTGYSALKEINGPGDQIILIARSVAIGSLSVQFRRVWISSVLRKDADQDGGEGAVFTHTCFILHISTAALIVKKGQLHHNLHTGKDSNHVIYQINTSRAILLGSDKFRKVFSSHIIRFLIIQ